jgi:GNAT superfamily N-acetyltransferase
MSGTAFRPATESDVKLLLGFMVALYEEDGSTPLDRDAAEEAVRRLLAAPECGLVWVIERVGEPAGYLVLTWGYSLEFYGLDAFIDELYVAPEYRGAGRGRQALEWAEATCRDRRHGFAERGLRLMTKRLSVTPARS